MNFLEENIDLFIKNLKKLISFKTFLNSKDDVYPNQEMKKALNFMKELAEKDGFKSFIDKDGHYGYIEIGEGTEMIAILTHIDVVPPGELSLWNTDPFKLVEKEGKLYGRGTSDDKGPLMLIYFLFKELKKYNLNKRIRLIFPTDEESKWRGVKKYNEKEEKPIFGFTPDSAFPVTFIEREILHIDLISKGVKDFQIKGGVAINVVPSNAKYIDNEKEITKIGKSAHAMHPEKGENALHKLFDELEHLNHPIISFVNKEIYYETNGKKLFNKLIKDDYAEITVNLGIADFNKNESKISIDMRIPVNSSREEVVKIIKDKIKEYGDIELKVTKHDPKVHVDKDSFIIKDLVESYYEITNERIEPQASGGGTYAKSMKNVVAFGPMFPWSEFTQHQPNEYISIDEYIRAYDIYKKVILKWSEKK